jgi:hypothetical protein
MAEVTIIKYEFREPEMFSEEDFLSYKQIFKVEPNHDIAPEASFWEEFSWFKWCLIALFGGIPLALIYDPLAFISGIAFFFLFFILLMGGAQSMWHYQTFLNKKNEYYYRLTNSIKSSENYQEFINKMYR